MRVITKPSTIILKHSQKPTVLLLTSSFPSSPGDETCGFIRDFARSLSDDFNVTVLAPPDRQAGEWGPDAFRLARSRSVVPLRFDPFQASLDLNELGSGGMLERLLATISVLCFCVRAFWLALRADVICSHWMVPCGLIGGLIARALGIPHLLVEHSGALHLLRRMRRGSAIARYIVRTSDQIVTVSSDLKEKLIELRPETAGRISVIPMGVNPAAAEPMTIDKRAFPGVDQKAPYPTILFVGRLVEIKGLDILLRAMEGLTGWRLIVAGQGGQRRGLEELSQALGIDARFVGRIGAAEREHLLAYCDAVVIPSRVLAGGRTEGTPVVCLEAMAAGKVVVASRVGGLAELIADGETGLLFDQNDHLALKQKLMLVTGDDRLRESISENARRAASRYEWPLIGPRYREILKGLLTKNDAIGDRRVETGIAGR